MTTLLSVAPDELGAVRELSHSAVQWASRAARANLPAAADDSHSNLGWDESQFGLISHPLAPNSRHQLGFSFHSYSLLWMEGGELTASFDLTRATEGDARAWCDYQLGEAGLNTTEDVELPYELPTVDYRDIADASMEELGALGLWFSTAQTLLDNVVAKFGDGGISLPRVRCWPHHYDLATLIVLDEGDPETARSVGVGLSPGDGTYAEPYFYCTPWPTPHALPEAPSPMRWNTEGFTALVLPAIRIEESTDLDATLTAAVESSLAILR